MQKEAFKIRPGWTADWQPAMELAWKTFLRFEAGDYSEEGIHNFRDFLADRSLEEWFQEGKYPLFVACHEQQVIGMVTLRNNNHVSLLFVDERHHRKGVGRALLQYASKYLETELKCSSMTVFAAPYAVEFYHAVGFRDLGPQMTREGITYTPMICCF